MRIVEPAERASPAVARELLDIWQRVASQHVSLGTGCACGIGGITLQLTDFEQDIIDYLLVQAERAKRADIAAYVRENAFLPQDGRASVGWLLVKLGGATDSTSVGTDPTAGAAIGLAHETDPDVAAFLLEKLGKTLRSFARLHK